jgi:4-amino-4-deoxy-L-arabinose transferase-like glycosyltransferase
VDSRAAAAFAPGQAVTAAWLASLPGSRAAAWGFVFLVVALCAVANLPWHLDNYDQAKQAFVSYEIAHGGDAFFQHTPRGKVATKPPLAGWLSLPVLWLTGSWDLAWRLPGFLGAMTLMVLLMREGARILPEGGATLAACAFGLNLLTPRLATLVRTDMLLTLWISVCGLLILRVVARGGPWTRSGRWMFFAAMVAALFTKGPILYVFLLPGMAAFALLGPRSLRGLVWSGWWTWGVPLALFLAWAGTGLLIRPDFYQEVVVEELFSRFDQSIKAHERQQPFWFYIPHLIHKFLPWSLLVIALPAVSRNVRNALRARPDILWLACWALGGLLLMTLVPSKRVDRIYPVLPPLCLLLVGMVSACRCGTRVRAWCGAAMIAAALFAGIYFAGIVWMGFRDGNDALVRFGRSASRLVAASGGGRLDIVAGKDEGLVIYAGGMHFTHPHRAARHWEEGISRALIIPVRRIESSDRLPDLPEPALASPTTPSGEGYLLFLKEPR